MTWPIAVAPASAASGEVVTATGLRLEPIATATAMPAARPASPPEIRHQIGRTLIRKHPRGDQGRGRRDDGSGLANGPGSTRDLQASASRSRPILRQSCSAAPARPAGAGRSRCWRPPAAAPRILDPLQMRRRLLGPPRPAEHLGQAVVELGIARVAPDRLAERFGGLLRLSPHAQPDAPERGRAGPRAIGGRRAGRADPGTGRRGPARPDRAAAPRIRRAPPPRRRGGRARAQGAAWQGRACLGSAGSRPGRRGRARSPGRPGSRDPGPCPRPRRGGACRPG